MSLFIGHNIIKLKSVDSTNSYAGKILKESKIPEGTIVICENQISGRGQQGNKWYSEPGKDITCSVILFPAFVPVNEQFYLTKAVSCAVADFVAEQIAESHQGNTHKEPYKVHIKWPNDIYVNDKKICGILIENSLRGAVIMSSVIGIGLNVNSEGFPEAVNSISLKQLTGENFDIPEVLSGLSSILERRYFQLRSMRYNEIDNDYLDRLYRFGTLQKYLAEEEEFEGKITGVSKSGKLLVRLKNGSEKEFSFKEIAYI